MMSQLIAAPQQAHQLAPQPQLAPQLLVPQVMHHQLLPPAGDNQPADIYPRAVTALHEA